MSEKKIISPTLAIQMLELGVGRIELQITETMGDLDTLWEGYQQAGEHLDKLRERKDQYRQAIRLLQ
ncbi:hypothetical protein SEA_MUSETTA_25 [Microbacterium phage Musetta]|nr:hypothetical protein SEA_MUSETTA_25 [Microbacterium phage Musetta]QYC54148.1 hypothetical protein SEA_WELCOME_26 [Microbacterium phage Welcome]UVK62443.1 hypothetical protein SEA_YUMA_25 [Microbacterium phage Yuma]